MNTFIRVAEVWVPSADGSLLELADGLFDAAPAFGAASRSMCFGRAEGLPGNAWDEGRPLLLRRLEGSYFRRTAAARAAGLTCAIALPIFVGEQLTCVVVLLCGDREAQVGAIELWRNDPRVESDLRLADGYFGATDPDLEALSRDSFLPRGRGLPGLAWQREAAVFIENIGESRHFLRAQAAAHAGIVRGLALPCSTRTHQTWVLSLLSSPQSPIARRIESWLPEERALAALPLPPEGEEQNGKATFAHEFASGQRLQRAFGFCEVEGSLTANGASAAAVDALGPIGLAWTSGVAQVAGGSATAGNAGSQPWQAAGLSSVLAIPLISDDKVSEVIALYF